mgnify:FL=1
MIVIGHLDSGIQSSLPAFTGRLDSFKDFTGQTCPLEDAVGHGTATASVIASLVPDAHFWVAKCTGAGHDISRLLQGLDWLAQSSVKVICMPVGIPGVQPVFKGIINYLSQLGKLVVVPIGNSHCHLRGGRIWFLKA